MKIYNIRTTSDDSNTSLFATIEFVGEKPKDVFFTISTKYKDFIYPDASSFFAALLMPSMKRKEDIHVMGSVSQKLIDAERAIQTLLLGWNIGLSKSNVFVGTGKKDTHHAPFVGCFFTGGVDSFYTFLKHKKDITHLILIHGCDIPLENQDFFLSAEKNVQKIAEESNISVLVIKTNLREIIEPKLEWEWELGSALAATGLLLRNGFKKVYIPSGMRKDQLCPYGTHPNLDPLFSTETLHIIHDGCEASRLEKVFAIAQSPLAMKYLRVCCHTIKGKYNCNVCMKCIQTKIDLLCADALENAESFDKKIDVQRIRKTYYDTNLNFHLFGEESLQYLKQHNKAPEVQDALTYSLSKSKKLPMLRKFAVYAAHIDKTYNKRRLYNAIFRLNKEHDRNFMFKSLSNLGLIK